MTGTLYIVSAPSGTGKTSLVHRLVESTPDIRVSVSYTTRERRRGEVDGEHYHFVEQAVFQDMINAGEFLEYAQIYGHYSGTGQKWVESQLAAGSDVLLEIDWQGAEQIRRLHPEAVGIFIIPPSRQVLETRLVTRDQDHPEVIKRRLAHANEEVQHCRVYDYLVINDQFDVALMDLQAIIRAKRLQMLPQLVRQAELLTELMV